MAASRRSLRNQGPEQLRPGSTRSRVRQRVTARVELPARPRVRLRVAIGALALTVSAALVLAYAQRLTETGRTTLFVPAPDVAAWMRIAGELENRVPPQLLLGGGGPNAELDTALSARGIRRSDFQLAASIVVRQVGESLEDVAAEALDAAFASYPLPEGVEVPRTASRPAASGPSDFDEARRLVLALTARIGCSISDSAPETENT